MLKPSEASPPTPPKTFLEKVLSKNLTLGLYKYLNRLLPKFPQGILEKLHFQSFASSKIAFFAISEEL